MTAVTRWAPLGLCTVALTVAALALSSGTEVPPVAALLGLVLLAAAGGLAADRSLTVRMATAAPGAALVGLAADLPGPGWVAAGVSVAALVVGPLAADADERWEPVGGAAAALAISSVALFLCVPDTEEATVLAVAAVAAAVASRVPGLRALGAAGTPALIGLFLWVGAFDARGRPAAFVGVVGTLALLALEPIGMRLRRHRHRLIRGRVAVGVLLVGQVALSLWASRVAGLGDSPARAVALLAPVIVVGIALGALAGRPGVARGPGVARR
jgi:hypothetical protein